MTQTISSPSKNKLLFPKEPIVVALLLLLGFALRLRQFLVGRSLWLDEAMLALNIVNRDFLGLFQPLDYDQGAPIGFLLFEKITNLLFGKHEFVFRLFPFVVGVVSLGLFYLLLRQTTSGSALLIGLALFAVSPELVRYAAEVKQYILDVAISIGLLILANPLFKGNEDSKQFIVLGIAGFMALWFSYPALFVLAGVGVSLLIHSLRKRDKSLIWSVLVMGATWMFSLSLLYFSSLKGLSQNSYLLEYWQENFMPIPPWTDWGWFGLLLRGMIQNQVGIYAWMWLVVILLTIGFIALFVKNRLFAEVILWVFIFSLIASGLRLYPVGGRLSLFLVPLLILLIAQAFDWIQYKLPSGYKLNRIVVLLVGIYLLYAPASESYRHFVEPTYREHIRPTMATLAENWEEGDVLFVSNGALPAFRFYAERYGLGDVTYQTSEVADYQNPEKILSQIDVLDGNPRVWVLMTHVYEHNGFNEKNYLLAHLDSIGELKREPRHPGTGVHLFLYDLSK